MMSWLAKALTAMRHPGRRPLLLGHLARTKFDYAAAVGSGIDASVVTAPIQWVQRAYPEGRLRVMRGRGDDRAEVDGHPLTALIARPNPFYGDAHLMAATIFSWFTAGNAYWLKVRNGGGGVAELWYVPHWTMAPQWPDDGSAFVSHYEYRPGAGQPQRIEPGDVVHFRHGIDPRNLRLGLSPLHGCLREIFMDLESSNLVASLLRNMGVPGLVLSPDGGARAEAEDVEAVKLWLREAFGGDRRGEPLVMGAPTKVSQYGFSPQQLDLSAARDVAEERVCAAIGIPAAVVGFGAGLQTAKVGATMGELRALAWHNGVIPLMRAFADEIERSLLPDFTAAARRVGGADSVDYDTAGVAALADDRLRAATAWTAMVSGGWAEVAEARAAVGLDVDQSHRIFLRPFAAIETPAGQPPQPPPPPAPMAARSAVSPAFPAKAGTQGKAARATPAVRDRLRRYVRAVDRLERPLARLMEGRLTAFFVDLGAAAGDAAAAPLLAAFPSPPPGGEGSAARPPGEGKQSPDDELLAGRIIEQLQLPLHATTFQRLYETHYLEVARQVAETGELIGLATGLPDPVARAVVAAGGRRSGLIDLADQARRSLFDALAEGRAAGEGAEQLAARIADQVAAGPWTSAETRARTIARTETKFAQNTSTMARAQHAGVERFVVFDGRLGPGRSDPEHIARDGSIVTADEAAALAAAEHPNGTLSFAPLIE